MLSLALTLLVFQSGELTSSQDGACDQWEEGQLPSAEQLSECWQDMHSELAQTTPVVMSDTTRACILEYAPDVEREFGSLDSGMYFIALSLCAVEIRGDLNAWQSQHRQLPWGEYSYRLEEGDTQLSTQAGESAEAADLSGEGQGIPVSIEPMGQALADYMSNQPPNVSVVSPYEMPAATYEFIGRTLLEIRINRNETERQEDN